MEGELESAKHSLERVTSERSSLTQRVSTLEEAHQSDLRAWGEEREHVSTLTALMGHQHMFCIQLASKHKEQLSNLNKALEESDIAVRESKARESEWSEKLADSELRVSSALKMV